MNNTDTASTSISTLETDRRGRKRTYTNREIRDALYHFFLDYGMSGKRRELVENLATDVGKKHKINKRSMVVYAYAAINLIDTLINFRLQPWKVAILYKIAKSDLFDDVQKFLETNYPESLDRIKFGEFKEIAS